jgi:hypothetical protein
VRPQSHAMREDAHAQRRMSLRRPVRDTMSARSTQPASSSLSILDEVAALTAEVREQVVRLRPLVDGRDIDPASELTVLLGALNAVATKLEARTEALRAGEPELPPAPGGGSGAAAPAPAPAGRGRDPEGVAREMVASGASRTEVEDFLRRHFDRAEARRIARRILRPAGEPRQSRRRDR